MTHLMYDSALQTLRQRRATISCNELIRLLTDLGYEVVKRNSGKHHTFNHPKIDGWIGGNFDCGHGRNPSILPAYINKIIKLLEVHKDEIKESQSDKNTNRF